MKLKTSLPFFLALCLLSTAVIAQKPAAKTAQKKTAAKPKAAAANHGLVVSLAELYFGKGENEYAGNVKVLRGAMKTGDKFEIITKDDKRVNCTVKTIQLQSNRLRIEKAGKDAELLLILSVDKTDAECDFGVMCALNTVKDYAEFEQIKKDYKPSPSSGKKGVDNSQLFSLDKE